MDNSITKLNNYEWGVGRALRFEVRVFLTGVKSLDWRGVWRTKGEELPRGRPNDYSSFFLSITPLMGAISDVHCM